MNDIIHVPPIALAPIGVTQGATEALTRLVARCKLVSVVANERTQEVAAKHAVEARTQLKRIEEARTAVKAPALEICRRIDDIAKAASIPLRSEVTRIERLMSDYHRELERQRIEKERLAREEQAKKIREAEAEAARIQQAAAEASKAAPTPVAAQQVLDLAAAQAKQVEAAAQAATQVVSAPLPLPPGARRRTVVHFEVTDKWALAAHDRSLVRLEAAAGAIRERIDAGMRECPGLKIWEEEVVGTAAR